MTTTETTKGTVPSHRKISLKAGLLYLLTFVSIPTLALYGPAKGVLYITSIGSDTGAIVSVILEIIVALAGIATAVVLFPLLKKQSESTAIGLVASRVLEAGSIFVGTVFMMAIVTLHQTNAGSSALASSHILSILHDRMFLQSQSFLPAINDLLLGLLLYKSRLVPRALSLIGIIGAFPLLAGYVVVMFNGAPQHGALAGLAGVMVALFELTLGLWLILKGFNPKSCCSFRIQKQTGLGYYATGRCSNKVATAPYDGSLALYARRMEYWFNRSYWHTIRGD